MAQVKIDDFQKMDIRIGTVIKAEVPKWSHWVIKLTVDFGPAFAKATAGKRERTIFAGVLGFYEPKDLKGKQAGVEKLEKSVKVMDSETDEKPVLLNPSEKVPNGTKVR
ncbi:MAG: Methionine-tRNA ligase [Candidatus Woesebacteria bacterium GW2011_GWB1_39_10b]|uniref:Methionine-tRNA ligase n=1 Tax=Candidatus Woesebacteria bacterium GW2011_GWB1_39_10b TaxID=1618573 RepID=A0A0G0LMS0_9BACT|nr:MAG: Methionine-tRNA ligase [Candidatus Woesebacteria bacterium GW2011_GWB1_39_10b]